MRTEPRDGTVAPFANSGTSGKFAEAGLSVPMETRHAHAAGKLRLALRALIAYFAAPVPKRRRPGDGTGGDASERKTIYKIAERQAETLQPTSEPRHSPLRSFLHFVSTPTSRFSSVIVARSRTIGRALTAFFARLRDALSLKRLKLFRQDAIAKLTVSLPGEIRRPLRIFANFLEAVRDHIYGVAANVKLRTKFLLSLILVTSALMAGTLLVVGRVAKDQVEQQIQEQSRNAALTFQVMEHQRRVALSHKAELLATLAILRNGDPTAVATASQDPWQSEDVNLYLMTDPRGTVTALYTTAGGFSKAVAEQLLRQSVQAHRLSDWWVSGGHLYQVVIEPVIAGADQGHARLGTVVVGSQIDSSAAGELGRISSTEVAFLQRNKVLVSTFSPLEERDLEQQSTASGVPQQVEIEGQRYIADSVDLNPGTGKAEEISLVVLKSYNEGIAYLAQLNRLLLWLLLGTVAVGAILVLIISDTFTRPLKALVGGVGALEQGDFEYPLKPSGNDEVAQVTRAFDRMRTTLQTNEGERLKLEEQLRRSQRMEAMGRLAGGVAHDFSNLLTVIKGHCDFLLEKLAPSDVLRGSGQQIAKAADRAASLTRQLLIFSRKQTTQPRVLDLNSVVSEMGKLLTRLVREDIEFSFLAGGNLGHVKADPCHVEQVVMNLVVNACDAMPSGGMLALETYNMNVNERFARSHPALAPGEYVVLAVTDTGCGMDEQTKAHIFEPFFTTKPEGKGTGLGLATVYGAVKQSNGFIWVESEPGKGARFEIYLPLVNAPLDAGPLAGASAVSWRTETVLIAEDEDSVRELACEYARSAGYKVLAARDGQEALALAALPAQPVHILLTDVVMPQMRGPELARQLLTCRPNLKVIFMSGYLECEKEAETLSPGKLFLQKPFTRDALILKLEAALSNGNSATARKERSAGNGNGASSSGEHGANGNGAGLNSNGDFATHTTKTPSKSNGDSRPAETLARLPN